MRVKKNKATAVTEDSNLEKVGELPSDSDNDKKQIVNGKQYSIYQIMGSMERKIYTAKSMEEYQSQLKVMNLAEMQNHAMNVSVKPMSDRNKLEQRLVKAFKEFISHYGAVSQSKQASTGQEQRGRALEILRAAK